MKIYISVDMEGIAGIVDWSQCRPASGRVYEIGCRLMLGEVNAAIDGAVSAGATDVLVNDSHGSMFNLDPDDLHPAAEYLSGRHKPDYMMQGLDPTFDAIFFIGYHGSITGAPSAMSHTYNPEVISGVRLGGDDVGEGGINALVAAAHQVPVALVTGDQVTLAETAVFAPDAETVQTKESLTRFAARNLHPATARDRIHEAAATATRRVVDGLVAPPAPASPIDLRIEFATADMAEVATWVRNVERCATRAVSISAIEPLAAYRAFVAVTYITRQAGGR